MKIYKDSETVKHLLKTAFLYGRLGPDSQGGEEPYGDPQNQST